MGPTVPFAVLNVGLVTSVGLNAPASCAALRAKVSNPVETRFMSALGEWIVAHRVELGQPLSGRAKLVEMAAMAIEEAMADSHSTDWSGVPVLLCVCEPERPGRPAGLDGSLLDDIQKRLGRRFSSHSAVVPHGKVGAAVALLRARSLIREGVARQVLIAATDSLVSSHTLGAYESADRLLSNANSNGFIAGEAAGAVLMGAPEQQAVVECIGLGFGIEPAPLDSESPTRAEGMKQAFVAALREADLGLHQLDFRISDISGEHYYFKEAALAYSRSLRERQEAFDMWHPAECIGETGAAAGLAVICQAHSACREGYALGSRILTHFANDSGQRAAAVLRFGGRA
jgi:3-oxoacyl-[acyl-carrier-protein] synthase I